MQRATNPFFSVYDKFKNSRHEPFCCLEQMFVESILQCSYFHFLQVRDTKNMTFFEISETLRFRIQTIRKLQIMPIPAISQLTRSPDLICIESRHVPLLSPYISRPAAPTEPKLTKLYCISVQHIPITHFSDFARPSALKIQIKNPAECFEIQGNDLIFVVILLNGLC